MFPLDDCKQADQAGAHDQAGDQAGAQFKSGSATSATATAAGAAAPTATAATPAATAAACPASQGSAGTGRISHHLPAPLYESGGSAAGARRGPETVIYYIILFAKHLDKKVYSFYTCSVKST